MQALDSGGNLSEVAAAHARRVQLEFENHLQQLVPWLQHNDHESQEAISAVMAEMDQWREADIGRRLDFGVAESAAVNSDANSSPPETGTAEAQNFSAAALDGDNGGQDEEEDDVEVQVRHFQTLLFSLMQMHSN